ncbi:MAG: PHP domain-containing protein [Clostridia bacterium]|nr:PHP domain-containing protein [Clostridia bacterium]MBP3648466.1 PHP domain-containing protein [Clostridia bacterium]
MSIQYSIDLHIHSTISDGLYTPAELYARARKEGMTAIALCDHDTVAGVPLMQEIIRQDAVLNPDSPPIRYLPSIELSTGDGGHAHLLGFGVNHEDEKLLSALAEMQEERAARSKRMICLLKKQGIRFCTHVEEELTRPGTGRAHIARALLEMGAVNTMQQAFDRYLARGKCAYIARRYMSIADGVSLLAGAGATVVLAHPCRLNPDPQGLRALVMELMDAGLSGLEAYHPSASRQQAPLIDSMARSLGLLVTGGSDYHGDANCCVRMGRMPSGWQDPESDLQALMERVAGR